MAVAVSKSVTAQMAVKTTLARVSSLIAGSVRRIICPAIFEEPTKKTILVPVSDDGWAPDFRCGEFAVIETTSTEPQDGAFVLVRLNGNNLQLVRLRVWTEKQAATVHPRSGVSEAPYWSMKFGRQRVGNWTPEDEAWAPDGYLHMSDGPAGDKFMRSMIVGRVVGVLGAHDRALNWRGTHQ